MNAKVLSRKIINGEIVRLGQTGSKKGCLRKKDSLDRIVNQIMGLIHYRKI
jgi:hypothetical protein